MVSIYSNVAVWSKIVTLLFKGCVCMLLKVFHSHCADNLLVKLMILMKCYGFVSDRQVIALRLCLMHTLGYSGAHSQNVTKIKIKKIHNGFLGRFVKYIFQFQVMTGLLLSVLL